ncbi:hypothetical protein SAMN06265222_106285 [Neorhodopirellula lusitana]|uniref:Secreted protein n=1 Tax=Neorhodopirellula lusitana TaxID=445327 RepID=A0ABY1Q6S0_9BACT|nr:hypothetical protein [Neorhodopirellula lusitana]SMP59896.1 hypothetical protein SAMN06265222_106285 [Neorhodopirellula lusitana]
MSSINRSSFLAMRVFLLASGFVFASLGFANLAKVLSADTTHDTVVLTSADAGVALAGQTRSQTELSSGHGAICSSWCQSRFDVASSLSYQQRPIDLAAKCSLVDLGIRLQI